MKVTAPGITIDLPPGWEAEIDSGAGVEDRGATGVQTPRVHIGNFPLPAVRGDFGSGAVEQMIGGDALICLLEESSAAAGSELHSHRGIPRLTPEQFSPNAMQRPLHGQSGTQVFFSEKGRAFVLYVVLGSHGSRASKVPEINDVLSRITIS